MSGIVVTVRPSINTVPTMAHRGRARKRVVRSADTTTLPLFASARRQVQRTRELTEVEARPTHISTGLPSVDRALRGGFPVGGTTLVAARLKVGATSMLIGAGLAALARDEPVSYFSERLREAQIRGRFVILESRVNGYRLRAGFVSAEDRIALASARERISWNLLSISARRRLTHDQIDANVFSYRPWLVIADIHPRSDSPALARDRLASLTEGLERLASLARKHQVALVVRLLLPKGNHPPDVLELPGLGRVADSCEAAVLLHRERFVGEEEVTPADAGRAEAYVVRVADAEVGARVVPLRFDQRFAGLLEV